MKSTLMLCLFFISGAVNGAQPPETVAYVDLNKYAGRWYEIATIPQWFEKNCVGSMADYSIKSNGTLGVSNSCYRDSFNGPLKKVSGIGRVVDKKSNAKLKVSFFWPFYGEYWIVDLAEDYSFAVVSNSKRTALWILSRKPKMDTQVYGALLDRLNSRQFDLSRLKATPQP